MEPDTLIQAGAHVQTWVEFATHVFDSIWKVIASGASGFLAGWLLMHKPKFMQRRAEADIEAEAAQ